MRGITTVLDAKIQIPRQPPGLLPRQRLVDALHDHVDCKLQYVIAPAGFGKTTLLAEFVHEAALPVCWATLDPGDRDTATFVETVVAAVRGVVPRFGARTLAALHGAPDLDARASALARLFLSEFQQQSDALTLLVLDDYHEVESGGPVTQFMNELLRLLPDNLRVVVAGRSLPDLTISRLLVERQVFGLGEADLRFTAAELATLLRRSGHNVTAEQATALADWAEGWIAGFLLSVPQLWEGLVAGMIAGSSGESPLYTYLAAEAFDRQPLDVQRFLLNTSVPETFDMELATCLLGQGDWPGMVDRIERAGLFLTRLPSARGTFRYHQLFRAFLQARLRAGAAGEFARLHG